MFKVICLMGPTCVGKTDLAVNLSAKFFLKIVSVSEESRAYLRLQRTDQVTAVNGENRSRHIT